MTEFVCLNWTVAVRACLPACLPACQYVCTSWTDQHFSCTVSLRCYGRCWSAQHYGREVHRRLRFSRSFTKKAINAIVNLVMYVCLYVCMSVQNSMTATVQQASCEISQLYFNQHFPDLRLRSQQTLCTSVHTHLLQCLTLTGLCGVQHTLFAGRRCTCFAVWAAAFRRTSSEVCQTLPIGCHCALLVFVCTHNSSTA